MLIIFFVIMFLLYLSNSAPSNKKLEKQNEARKKAVAQEIEKILKSHKIGSTADEVKKIVLKNREKS